MPLRTVRILCFGDSLTAGYTAYGNIYHPYAHTMMKRIRAAFPEIKFEVAVKGLPGDMVVDPGQFRSRMTGLWKENKYDWVIVLGGTNDLARPSPSFQPQKIFESLELCWDECLRNGAKVFALTVPECHAKNEALDKRRNRLNDLIKGYTREGFHIFDLHSVLPYHSMPESSRENIWDDGLHLTPAGYDAMGSAIAATIIPLLKEHIDSMPPSEPPQHPAATGRMSGQNGRRRRHDPKDDMIYSEEDDADSRQDISHGWIVVRQRDLD